MYPRRNDGGIKSICRESRGLTVGIDQGNLVADRFEAIGKASRDLGGLPFRRSVQDKNSHFDTGFACAGIPDGQPVLLPDPPSRGVSLAPRRLVDG